MSIYRNDQEATLARLDALDAEHARVVAENEQLRAALRRASRRPANVHVVGRDAQVVATPAAAVESSRSHRTSGKELAVVSIAGLIAAVLVVVIAITIATP